MQFDVLEKKFSATDKLGHLKFVANGHQHAKTTEDEKVYILNKCTYYSWQTV